VRDGRRPIAPFVALGVAALLAVFFVILATASGGERDTAATPLLGRPAPDVRTVTLDGEPFDLSRRKGSWVVLNFFNSTCVPCVQEHPELVAFAQQQAALADGAEVYTVVNDDREENVRRFFAENGGDWPILADDLGSVSVAFGVARVPETWIIDPNGIVVQRQISKVVASQLAADIQRFRELEATDR
jgi:cytochrome c biogenesis protein CcmG/thiol:disulfide interchange protein DsbE